MRSLRSAAATQENSVGPGPGLRVSSRLAVVGGAIRRAPKVFVSIALALVFLYPRFFLLSGTPFAASGDQMLFFSRALRLLHGQVLYRDVFEIVGSGTEAIYAAGFWLFGQHAWVIEAWHVVLGCAFCVVLTWIGEQILEGAAVFLPVVAFLVFDFSSAADATHHWYSTLAVLCAVSILMRGRQLRRVALAGILCGVAILFTQTQGGMVAIAIGIYLLLSERKAGADSVKTLLTFCVPCVFLLFVVFGYYVLRAGFHTLFYDLVIFPLTGLSGPINSPRVYFHQLPEIHGVAGLLQATPFFVIVALVPYVYFITLYVLWKRALIGKMQGQQMLLLCVCGIALFIAVCSGPTFFRLSTIAPLAILCCVWLIEQSRHARTVRPWLFCAMLGFFVWLPVHRQVQWHRKLALPTGNVAFTDRGSYQLMQWLLARTQPGDGFFNDDAAEFYLKLRNPTDAEFVNNDAFTSPEDVARIIAAMQKTPPRYVAMLPGIPETPYDHAGPFRSYVHSNYCIANTFVVFQRGFTEEIWGSCGR